jgi:hypothetical protein
MSDYRSVKTSAEVAAVIRAAHPEMVVFGSFSDPTGGFMGGPCDTGRMETEYGFANHDFPTFRVRTTWAIGENGREIEGSRKHEYWLCIGKEEL